MDSFLYLKIIYNSHKLKNFSVNFGQNSRFANPISQNKMYVEHTIVL